MGVGAKIHILQKHLLHSLSELDDEDGLGIWSEAAIESSHGAFKQLRNRYSGIKDGFLFAVMEYNFLKL